MGQSVYNQGISIVVPTEGRISLTRELLQSLVGSRGNFRLPCEILIVDSSQEEDKKKIAAACKQCDAILINGSRNVREKRNLGIQYAQYSVILFIDSDCRPTSKILEEHWRCYHNKDTGNLGGVLGQVLFEGSESWVWRMVKYSSLVAHFTRAEQETTANWGATANISFRHEVLDKVGWFDTNLPFRLGGDDLDLSYRVTQAGFTIECNSEALVYHSRRTWNSLHAVLNRAFRWGRMEYYLYRKHPGARVLSPPGFWGWAFLVGVLFFIEAIVGMNQPLTMIGAFLLWVSLSLLLFSFLSVIDEKESLQNKIRMLGESLLTAIPELTFQFGAVLEFIRHIDFRFLWTRIWFEPSALRNNWIFEAWNVWSNLFALLICQLILFGLH